MSKLYSRKQIAELIEQTPAYVGIYVGREKLIEINRKIDISNPINKAFIAKFTSKAANELIENNSQEQKKEEIEKSKESKSSGITPTNVDYVKKQHEIKKLKSEISLRDLEFDKKKAKVMPTEFVIEIIQRYLNGTCGGIINSGNIMIDDICKEFKLDNKHKLNYKKRLKAIVSDTIKSKHQPVTDEVIEYAKEYALMARW